jgi:hypothetical protein
LNFLFLTHIGEVDSLQTRLPAGVLQQPALSPAAPQFPLNVSGLVLGIGPNGPRDDEHEKACQS